MSVVGNNRVGIPIVVLHDAEGAVIEVETKKGELIRGLLFEAEDMMNLYVKNATIVDSFGSKRKTNQVYIRGPEIVLIVLPDMLKNAPMFNRIKHWRKHGGAPPEGVGQAVGQAAAIIRKATERRRGGFSGAPGRTGSGGPPTGGNTGAGGRGPYNPSGGMGRGGGGGGAGIGFPNPGGGGGGAFGRGYGAPPPGRGGPPPFGGPHQQPPFVPGGRGGPPPPLGFGPAPPHGGPGYGPPPGQYGPR